MLVEDTGHRKGWETAALNLASIMFKYVVLNLLHSICILTNKLGKREVANSIIFGWRQISAVCSALIKEAISLLESGELISDYGRTSRTKLRNTCMNILAV
ncbi:hypothetical protein PMAYCL1PPCAC_09857 [Pristionchus mayeri]|uniref:Uncharacterized protein n=1 Tax=Pristionchus mayeri TaxID=1317129 RepID=A0AAN5CDL7_9BILA|nr:hypothetical protein PMAYCL1PPCAC_09857 [Pristionchus mayeri]